MNNLNILFIGDIGSGKTTFLNAAIKEYYKGFTYKQYQDNILHINSLKEQGINYYRNDVKTFCQTCSSIKNKKKIIVLDDITPKHPNMMALFEYIMKEFNYSPVAFSPGKIAVIHPEQKESFLLLVKNHIIIESLKVNGANHSCSFNSNPIWGTYLQLNK